MFDARLYIIILSFFGVLFSLVPAGSAVQKILLFLLLIILMLMRRDAKYSTESLYIILPYVLFICYCAMSAYWMSGSISYATTSIITLFLGVVYYLYLTGSRFSSLDFVKLKKYLLILLLFQIAFVIIKLFFHGIDEKFLIGTMSNTAGQLGFLFPAIAIPIVCYFTANKNIVLMWLLIILLGAFGLINEKRSIVFLLPFIIYASVKINSDRIMVNSKSNMKIGLIGMLVVFGITFFGAHFIPSLNMNESYGGAVNFIYLFEYALEYLTMDYGGTLQGSYNDALLDAGVQIGRITLLIYIVDWIKQQEILTILFGIGFGAITPSDWLANQSDPLFNLIGARGAISGFGLTLIETGVVGSILMFIFFINILLKVLILSRNENDLRLKRWYKTVVIILFVFMYDYFFYSTVLLRVLPMPIILFSIIASIGLKRKNLRRTRAVV
jgi:hypothetical protein